MWLAISRQAPLERQQIICRSPGLSTVHYFDRWRSTQSLGSALILTPILIHSLPQLVVTNGVHLVCLSLCFLERVIDISEDLFTAQGFVGISIPVAAIHTLVLSLDFH